MIKFIKGRRIFLSLLRLLILFLWNFNKKLGCGLLATSLIENWKLIDNPWSWYIIYGFTFTYFVFQLTKIARYKGINVMSIRGGGRRGYGNRTKLDRTKPFVGDKGKEVLKQISDDNPILKAFRGYAQEIDEKHDRHERIVKLSRDITIESKRIIFLLHNVDKENKRDDILKEADIRLKKLLNTAFKNIALELENEDPFQYLRAYSGGLQEFIEALTFHQYLKSNSIQHWTHVENDLTYSLKDDKNEAESSDFRIVKTKLPPTEFFLGVADLTGELMRKCINNLGSGNIDDCFLLCNFVKNVYSGFVSIGNVQSCREFGKKVYVLKQSLFKMEHVCYNIIVRGSEIPKHMLANVIPTSTITEVISEDDEGYF